MKRVLLVGDIVSHGKIALSTMIPILSKMKLDVSNLPTSIVSNTFDYRISELHDLTDYMRNTVEIWDTLDFQFDVIVTGFINSEEQVEIIGKLLAYQKKKPLIITDPIMGDDGELYHGLPLEIIDHMKKMISHSDIILPNVTEAALLLDEKPSKTISESTAIRWLNKFNDLGLKSAVLTSVLINGDYYVYGLNLNGEPFKIKYEVIPYKFAGTGDIFSSFMTGKITQGHTVEEAARYSSSLLSKILKMESIDVTEKVRDVPIERYLDLID